MTKHYFIKYSYQDPAQHLRRIHDNGKAYLDINGPLWNMIDQVKKDCHNRTAEDITIDFMIEIAP